MATNDFRRRRRDHRGTARLGSHQQTSILLGGALLGVLPVVLKASAYFTEAY